MEQTRGDDAVICDDGMVAAASDGHFARLQLALKEGVSGFAMSCQTLTAFLCALELLGMEPTQFSPRGLGAAFG